MKIQVVGEDGEVSICILETAVNTTIVRVANSIKLPGIVDGERPQQDALHQRKDGGVGSDTQSERNDDSESEAGRLAQLPQRVFYVCQHSENLHSFAIDCQSLSHLLHSPRSASIGFKAAALRAGMNAANKAAIPSRSVANNSITGS